MRPLQLLAIASLFLMPLVSEASSTTPKPTGLGPRECIDVPNKFGTGRACVWRSACPGGAKGTLDYGIGLGEKVTAPDEPATLLVPAHDEFKAMAMDECLDLLVHSWSNDNDLMPGHMIRPPGTKAETAPSPSWDEVNKALDKISVDLKIKTPIFGYGQSQGGFNLSTIAILKPGYFKKLLLTHPVMGPYPGTQYCPKPIPGQFITPCYTMLVMGNFWPQEWLIANPIVAVKKAKSMPPVHVLACEADEFGLFRGPQDFCNAMKAKGFDCTFEIAPKGCKHAEAPTAISRAFVKP